MAKKPTEEEKIIAEAADLIMRTIHCKRCGWMKFLDDFKVLKILNRPR